MSTVSHIHTGQCHCGAIKVTLTFTRPAEEMQVRACQCTFCTRQASLTVSDPKGSATFEIEAGAFPPPPPPPRPPPPPVGAPPPPPPPALRALPLRDADRDQPGVRALRHLRRRRDH